AYLSYHEYDRARCCTVGVSCLYCSSDSYCDCMTCHG
ncbi:hypothetical protein JMJ77_0014163, partial [Colletotrichum scovillei]